MCKQQNSDNSVKKLERNMSSLTTS